MPTKFPTAEEVNAQYMMDNPQYSYTVDPTTNPKTGLASTSLPKKEVSSLSTDGAKFILNNAIQGHNNDLTAIKNNTTTAPVSSPTSAPLSADTLNLLKSNGAITADEFSASGFNKADYNFDATANVYLPKNGQNVAQSKIDADNKAEADYIRSSFATQIAGMDIATQNLINSIQGIYGARVAEQQDANRRELAAFDTMNTRYGTSRYAPGVAQGILTADERVGLDRIKKIGLEETNLIATANQNLVDKKYSSFVQQRNELNELRKEKVAQLNKLQDLAIEKQKYEREKLQKFNEELNKIAIDAKKNGADDATVNAITSAKSISEAVKASGDFLQTGTGIVGEYAMYKRDAISRGLTPLSFDEYQTKDANRKISIARAGVGGTGVNSATLTKALQVAGQFDNEQSVKNYQVVGEAKSFIDSLGTGKLASAADDQGLLYAFAKVMDPNSVVREGEYATVQKYSQSWAQTFGFKAERIFSNTPFLSDSARRQMKDTVEKKYNASDKNYTNIKTSYVGRINKITGKDDGADYITDYSGGFGKKIIDEQEATKEKVIKYGTENASDREKIRSLLTKVQSDIGRPYTYEEVAQLYNIK